MEVLEDRNVLSPMVFVVTSTADTATPGTLRQAILDANANPGLDTIDFNIPGGGVPTIDVTSPLPAITSQVTIDATSQPNSARVTLDGGSAGDVNGLVLDGAAGGSTIRGLVIDNFGRSGIRVNTDQNSISGNIVGADPTGTQARGNGANHGFEGIAVYGGANLVQNNLISGNVGSGVSIQGNRNALIGNIIGLDGAGDKALTNVGTGVEFGGFYGQGVGGTNNVIYNNVISANTFPNINLLGAKGNLIEANLIGTDATGTQARANAGGGYRGIDLNAFAGQNSENNMIKGNTISGNGGYGVFFWGADNNVVLGNRIGTDVTGRKAVPNDGGIGFFPSPRNTHNVIYGNIISGNTRGGIAFTENGPSSIDDMNILANNIIGASATLTALGNAGPGIDVISVETTIAGNVIWFNTQGVSIHGGGNLSLLQSNSIAFNTGVGVSITSGATNNTIGGTQPGLGNAIIANGGAGVLVDGLASLRNAIERNAIFANAAGIVLTNGGNINQPSPVLVSAFDNGSGTTTVSGTLHAAANETFRVEFFDNPSGGVQGLDFLGFLNVTTDGNGDATLATDLMGDAVALTATATDPIGNTSAFSAVVRVGHS